MRLAVVAAVLLGGCSDPRDCSIGAVERDYVVGATLDDCGSLYDDGISGTGSASFQAGQACALDHAQQHIPFQVTWTAQGIDTQQLGAYVGLTQDGVWTLASFQQFTAITGRTQPTERDACTGLAAVSPCSSLRTDLCIQCVGRTSADQCMP